MPPKLPTLAPGQPHRLPPLPSSAPCHDGPAMRHPLLLHSVSYAGLWGQHRLDLPSFSDVGDGWLICRRRVSPDWRTGPYPAM